MSTTWSLKSCNIILFEKNLRTQVFALVPLDSKTFKPFNYNNDNARYWSNRSHWVYYRSSRLLRTEKKGVVSQQSSSPRRPQRSNWWVIATECLAVRSDARLPSVAADAVATAAPSCFERIEHNAKNVRSNNSDEELESSVFLLHDVSTNCIHCNL